MSERLLIRSRAGETQIARLADRRLIEFIRERPETASLVGNIYLGRVTRVEKGLQAAFVDIGLPRQGFLPLGEIDGPVEEGTATFVQVTRDARAEKGVRLSGRPTISGAWLVLDPVRPGIAVSSRVADKEERKRLTGLVAPLARAAEGFVVRRAAVGLDEIALAAEADRLRALWQGIVARRGAAPPVRLYDSGGAVIHLLRDDGGRRLEAVLFADRAPADAARRFCEAAMPVFLPRIRHCPEREWVPSAAEIEEQVEAALDARVPLPSGAWLLFEPGETLTAIDVNSGRDVGGFGGTGGAERTLLKINLEAAAEIGRQLRLRNLGGIIVIDFIDLRSRAYQQQVVEALRAAVADDPMPCRIEGMSRLGLVEMTRRRQGPSLSEMATRRCAACDGRGYVPAGWPGSSEV